MEKIEVPEYEAVAMEQIAPGVAGLKVAFVNVYGVVHGNGSWTLIDAAIPFSATRIKDWAHQTFGRAPEAILLTHGHFDHVSAAKELADTWDVPIFAHREEMPYLTGAREYPAPNWKAGGGAMSLMSPVLPRGPIDLGSRLLPLPGETAMPGWRLLHTPGHTPGHVSLYRDEDRTLLVGDAFCTTQPESFFAANFAQPAELHGPPSYFTSDWVAAKRSVRVLASLNPRTVAPGHGRPLSGDEVPERLQLLAENFEQVAVPDNLQ
jgi:glyoxylase-like metal-dependent hydrolase (beta-lactamase superfamily II)